MLRLPTSPMMQAYLSRRPNSIFNMLHNKQQSVPSFDAGGMMSNEGTAIRPDAGMQADNDEQMLGAATGAPVNEQQLEQEAQQFVRNNPQVVQKLQALIVAAMQSGELTTEELNLAVQLAKAALANPASYPQLRQYAIKNGLGTEADLPQTVDKGLLFTLLVVGKTLQSAGNMATQQSTTSNGAAGLVPEYSEGGMTGEKKHLAMVHPREYIIPEDALLYHGKKHFDKLIEQARAPKDGSAN